MWSSNGGCGLVKVGVVVQCRMALAAWGMSGAGEGGGIDIYRCLWLRVVQYVKVL